MTPSGIEPATFRLVAQCPKQKTKPATYQVLPAVFIKLQILYAGTTQSAQRLATGWTVRGSNPGGGARFSPPVQTGPEAPSASYKIDTR